METASGIAAMALLGRATEVPQKTMARGTYNELDELVYYSWLVVYLPPFKI